MSIPKLVDDFYARIWNSGDLEAADDLLTGEFTFRGSVGTELRGVSRFRVYVRTILEALADYRCDIISCVSEGEHAFAKMRFSGKHVGPFRGFQPTGCPVHWLGAALFRFEQGKIAELWVLGDLASLDELLHAQATQREPS